MRKYNSIYIYLLLVAILYSGNSIAQDGTYVTTRDFETWTGLTLNYKFDKKLRFSLNEQLRMKDNSSIIDQYFTQFETRFKVTKDLSLNLGLRYIKKNDNVGKIQGYETHFRWHTDIGYKHKLDRFALNYRLRYQSKDEWETTSDEINNTVRFKLGTGYNIKNWKLDPSFAAEIFNSITKAEGFNKLRLTLGTEYKIKKFGEIGAFYRMEKQLVGEYPKTTNIAGFKYAYTIKR